MSESDLNHISNNLTKQRLRSAELRSELRKAKRRIARLKGRGHMEEPELSDSDPPVAHVTTCNSPSMDQLDTQLAEEKRMSDQLLEEVCAAQEKIAELWDPDGAKMQRARNEYGCEPLFLVQGRTGPGQELSTRCALRKVTFMNDVEYLVSCEDSTRVVACDTATLAAEVIMQLLTFYSGDLSIYLSFRSLLFGFSFDSRERFRKVLVDMVENPPRIRSTEREDVFQGIFPKSTHSP